MFANVSNCVENLSSGGGTFAFNPWLAIPVTIEFINCLKASAFWPCPAGEVVVVELVVLLDVVVVLDVDDEFAVLLARFNPAAKFGIPIEAYNSGAAA